MTCAFHARAARLRTIADSRAPATPIEDFPFGATPVGTHAQRRSVPAGALPDYNGGATAQAQALRSTLLGPGDLQNAKRIDQSQVVSRLGIAVGAQQRKGVVAGLDQRLPEAAEQMAVDIGDEVAEVID